MTETTPGSLSNGASMHQKQPPANVAFSTFPASTVEAAMNDNSIMVRNPFRFGMVLPPYFPSFSDPANTRAAEFMQ